MKKIYMIKMCLTEYKFIFTELKYILISRNKMCNENQVISKTPSNQALEGVTFITIVKFFILENVIYQTLLLVTYQTCASFFWPAILLVKDLYSSISGYLKPKRNNSYVRCSE